ncbi:TM2 domain-containing membrane protein YozV [Weissella uvarum]|uniref:TM2 domain-containing protein n=1 Tax=Weissella uvarum TaxID=1479233 RepID=UPI0019613153|nr:TM2 domain-containing protein [Weissella uvarum]MBM7617000.1 TM2 domain-containing membrane protein YozV [Weissella uvarum]MCM0595298.1 TM2 domain-containing protein [Weissella uvarum]
MSQTNSNPKPQTEKSKAVAYILAILLGYFGAHRFYLGKTKSAVAMLLIAVLTAGAGTLFTFFWVLYDLFKIPGWVDEHNRSI